MKYDLEQIGSSGFQELAGSLAIAYFGPQVQVLGSGRDGGRDMFCRGTLVWRKTEDQPGEAWDGYTIFQAKHKERLADRPSGNLSWIWAEVKKELDRWADPEKGREEAPNYWVIVTNVPLTPTPDTGGLAMLSKSIQKYIDDLGDASRDVGSGAIRKQRHARMLRLKKWRIWDGNQIEGLLNAHEAVRQAFTAFVTPGDVLGTLRDHSPILQHDELEEALQVHARAALVRERNLYFDEAGDANSAGTPVEQVAIDLPVTVLATGENTTVMRHVLDRAEHVLRPKVSVLDGPRHLVIAGAPGNGKTTISKFVVQAYRASLLNGAGPLATEHEIAIKGTETALRRMHLQLPRFKRWPMRIDLAQYVEEGGLSLDGTLLRWIAAKVTDRLTTKPLKAWALKSWMHYWPGLLVLDGLDEVSDPATRQRLLQQIVEFVTEAEAENHDLFVIVTTRPTGYVEELPPEQFTRVDLASLTPQQAVAYGTLATRVRLRNDEERIDRVVKLLKNAASNEALRNLLRTPLQVLIMTIIAESSSQFAPDRFSLFWGYYQTICRREQGKDGGFGNLIRTHEPQILDLHERIGLLLQQRSEVASGAMATLSVKELRDTTWKILDDIGYRPSSTDARLLDQIMNAATHRLVLIAPRDEGFGFDVRSLQELMAARRLTAGPVEQVADRLRLLAPSPHWRNTWIFAAGRYFSEPQVHQHETIVSLVEKVDSGACDRLGAICPVGPELALDIVDDGMAMAHPKWNERLLAHGLTLLLQPPVRDVAGMARILVRAAQTSDALRSLIGNALREALRGTRVARSTAERLQEVIPSAASLAGAGLDVSMLSTIKQPTNSTVAEPVADWDQFHAAVEAFADADSHSLASTAAMAIELITDGDPVAEVSPAIIEALDDANAAEVIETALEYVIDAEPRLLASLRDGVIPSRLRLQLADKIAF